MIDWQRDAAASREAFFADVNGRRLYVEARDIIAQGGQGVQRVRAYVSGCRVGEFASFDDAKRDLMRRVTSNAPAN